MKTTTGLAGLLEDSARRFPDAPAVGMAEGPSITYAQLDALSDRMRDCLWLLGVRPGDRVGLRLHKSIDGIITIFGYSRLGRPTPQSMPSRRSPVALISSITARSGSWSPKRSSRAR